MRAQERTEVGTWDITMKVKKNAKYSIDPKGKAVSEETLKSIYSTPY